MKSAASIRAADMRLIEDVFEMGGGYVLDFTDQTFAEFFYDELGVNIDDSRFLVEGSSKAKRLRYFLRTCDPGLRVKALLALWEYREANRRRNRVEETIPDAESEFHSMIERLGGQRARRRESTAGSQTQASVNRAVYDALRRDLMALGELEPQARGYAFESFLKGLFDANGLSPRASFRLLGEQIDGSFEMLGETYLLEAKWTGPPVGASDLRSFNGKVEDKAAWSRGLFVSHSGFSKDGLVAFSRGKRVVCMDGLDLHDMLEQGLPFTDVMSRKVRRAAESGNPFVRVQELY